MTPQNTLVAQERPANGIMNTLGNVFGGLLDRAVNIGEKVVANKLTQDQLDKEAKRNLQTTTTTTQLNNQAQGMDMKTIAIVGGVALAGIVVLALLTRK
jgi:hypothetical protein